MHRITLVKTGTEGRTQVTPVSLQNTYTGHREKTFAIEALFFVAYALAKVHQCRFVLASQRFDDLQTGRPCHVHRERAIPNARARRYKNNFHQHKNNFHRSSSQD
jgi:hypothetical protein